jgi:hypothetical protein
MSYFDEISIEKLNFPRSLFMLLRRNGFTTIGQLQVAIQDGSLGEIRLIGTKRIKDISNALSNFISQMADSIDTRVQSVDEENCNVVTNNFLGLDISHVNNIAEIRIDRMELPTRIIAALRRSYIHTIGDLLSIGEEELLRIGQIGPKSLNDIRTSLKKLLGSPAGYFVEAEAPTAEKLMSWAELIEPYLSSEKHTRIYTLISRFGLDPKTLEETARKLGVTRERVRQVQYLVAHRFTKHINAHRMSSSLILAKALEIMANRKEDLSLYSFRSDLHKAGVLGEINCRSESKFYKDVSPFEMLMCWLAILGDQRYTQSPEVYPIALDDLRKAKRISIRENTLLENIPRKKRRNLLRKVAFTGGISMQDAMRILSTPADIALLALRSLKLQKIKDPWYSVTEIDRSRNRLPILLAAEKMLWVAEKIEYPDFYDGLRRHSARFFDSIAPPEIVAHYLQVAGFTIMDNTVSSDTKITNPLSKTEECFITAVRANENVANFIDIAEKFLQRGFSIPAVSVVLARSPVVEKIDTGLYKIRGCEVSWSEVENAKKRQKSFSKDTQILYGLDGTIKYRITLNSWAVYTGVVSTNLIKDLAGEWNVINQSEKTVKASMDELFIFGIGGTLKEIQANIGERVELCFNTWNRTLSIKKVEHGSTG